MNVFQIIAHRGDSGARPEESTSAYESAAAAGAAWLECDVQVTSDRVPVCAHSIDVAAVSDAAAVATLAARRIDTLIDPASNETLRGVLPFPAVALRELQALRLMRDVRDVRGTAFDGLFPFVTLREFLALAAALSRDLGVYVEAKTPQLYAQHFNISVEPLIAAELAARRPRPRLLLESFEAASLARFAADHGVPRAELVQLRADAAPRNDWPALFAALAPLVGGVGLSKQLLLDAATAQQTVRAAHDRGLFVHVWTLRASPIFWNQSFASFADELRHFQDLHVDGVFTDDPGIVRRWLDDQGTAAPPAPEAAPFSVAAVLGALAAVIVVVVAIATAVWWWRKTRRDADHRHRKLEDDEDDTI
jgi:glycerophosphoryl diester phosphodiesterase